MDKKDKAILRHLFMNCRASYRSLAKKFNLSPNTIKNRISKMCELGVIRKFQIWYVNPDTIPFFGLIYTDGTENSEEFLSCVGKSRKIGYALTITTTEGGAYFIEGGCDSPNDFAELRAMLGRIDHVVNVELHMTVFHRRGTKIEFSKPQLRVIRCLLQDARMRIEEISKRTGMAAKTVRRILKELEQSKAIHFSCRANLSAGGMVDCFLRIEYDDKKGSFDDVHSWIRGEYQSEVWWIFVSPSDSVMFASLVLDNVLELESISKRIREAPFVKSTTPLVVIADHAFEYQDEDILRKMLDEAGV
ncbi:MAG: winged helix-turn-helix transcriptional regulator [Promethearchaeota archaeon]